MIEISKYVDIIEHRQQFKIAYLEEIVWRKGFMSESTLHEKANELKKSSYYKYLKSQSPNLKCF